MTEMEPRVLLSAVPGDSTVFTPKPKDDLTYSKRLQETEDHQESKLDDGPPSDPLAPSFAETVRAWVVTFVGGSSKNIPRGVKEYKTPHPKPKEKALSTATKEKPWTELAGVTPIGDRILIEPFAVDDMSEGGIALPDDARDYEKRGTVVAVGAGPVCQGYGRVTPIVKVGDIVAFEAGSSPLKLDHEGVEYTVVMEKQIIAVVVRA